MKLGQSDQDIPAPQTVAVRIAVECTFQPFDGFPCFASVRQLTTGDLHNQEAAVVSVKTIQRRFA